MKFLPRRQLVLFGGLAVALAACSEAGIDGDPPAPGDPYTQIFDESRTLFPDVANAPSTEPGAMPDSGTARYSGVAGLSSAPIQSSYEDAELLGRIEVQAEFARATISGRMHSFHDNNDTAFGGEATLSAGRIVGTNFESDFAGTLTNPEGSVNVEGTLSGEFAGTRADRMRGLMSGTRTLSDGTGSLYGLFVAKRD